MSAPTTARHRTDTTATQDGITRAESSRPVPWRAVWRVASFVIACALLVGCAFAIGDIAHWQHDYGQVVVFLALFLVMSLAGKWFWTGIDAALRNVIVGRAK